MGAADEHQPVQEPSVDLEKIFVSVRLRPLNEKEIAKNDVSDWECINDTTIIYRNNLSVSERSMYPTAYSFDRVFSPDCSTREVYKEGAKEAALSVISGINSSVFAYGQTSSGKTYTMSGITEFTVADIYDYIEKHKERKYILKFSAMEIYNESVRDLLSADTTPLRLLDDPERGTVVERLTEESLRDWNHFQELLAICEAQRQIGETNLNETSSRSHQILRLTIESSAREFLGNEKSSILMATVNFVDLAGSERASQSLSAGMRLKEGCHINRSLLTLGTVIRKLSKGRNGHIPFRDSKLTRILQSSLGGNARTAIICTLSPARCHVEQSRNTLLFASCAKEVTTNAQVNVVMSDKALVKQLQRELARLENELRSTGTNSVSSDSSTLLREKDLQIEKLLKEVADLTRKLNVAQSQVDDLLLAVEEVRPSALWVDPDHQYPKLHVRSSARSENSVSYSLMSDDVNVRSFSASQCSEHSSSSSCADENFVQMQNFEGNFHPVVSSPELSVRNAMSVGNDLNENHMKDETTESLDSVCKEVQCIEVEESSTKRCRNSQLSESSLNGYANLNDVQLIKLEEPSTNIYANSKEAESPQSSPNRYENLKEVQCIEVEEPRSKRHTYLNMSESSPNRYADSGMSSPNVNTVTSGVTEMEHEDTTIQDLGMLPTLKGHKKLNSDFVIPSPEKPSPWMLDEGKSSLKLIRSRSCRARLMNSLPKSWFDKEEINESTPHIVFKKEFIGRPEGSQRKLSALKYHFDVENSSTNGSETSMSSIAVDELKVASVETLNDWNSTRVSNLEDDLVQVTKPEPIVSEKNVKDVGLDPIQDDVESGPNWSSEFMRLQREIIELWHVLNVSLVHRTYFFLLFKGDPTDSFYMEVEHRRLSFLKDAFSRGKKTIVDGQILTLDSSKKALNQERQMLCKQMQKRLSRAERENIFLKWGIALNANQRRLQLVHSLWTKTADMDHITESAVLVAKLVGFEEQEQALKDMFGLLTFTFTPRHTPKRRSSLWKRRVLSIL